MLHRAQRLGSCSQTRDDLPSSASKSLFSAVISPRHVTVLRLPPYNGQRVSKIGATLSQPTAFCRLPANAAWCAPVVGFVTVKLKMIAGKPESLLLSGMNGLNPSSITVKGNARIVVFDMRNRVFAGELGAFNPRQAFQRVAGAPAARNDRLRSAAA